MDFKYLVETDAVADIQLITKCGFFEWINAAVVHVAKCLNLNCLHEDADTYCKLRVEMPREIPEVNLVKKT